MYMSQAEAKFLAEFIASETKDLRERIEKLEAERKEPVAPALPSQDRA